MTSLGTLDDKTIAVGLLMESAQTQQRMAEEQLNRLNAHVQGLDGVVREEIRHTLVDEIKLLSAEIDGTVRALHGVRRATRWHTTLFAAAAAFASALAPVAAAHWLLPSAAEIAVLRAQQQDLTANLRALKLQGGLIELRHCGTAQRLCVRVDAGAPKYGEAADFFVAHGY
jgi:hypothetical protein